MTATDSPRMTQLLRRLMPQASDRWLVRVDIELKLGDAIFPVVFSMSAEDQLKTSARPRDGGTRAVESPMVDSQADG